MPRRKSDDPRDLQLLVRLTRSDKRVLVAAAALDQVTVNVYIHNVIVRAIQHLRDDPLVSRQLDLFDEQAARRGGNVVPIGAVGRSEII
jgi:uncharacterized protein (DUF1778 family)